MRLVSYLVVITLLFACKENTKQEEKNKVDQELQALFTLMQGSYNSEKQATQDSTYYNISLHMYPIWEDKGNFLYVEQALNSMQNKPYRQRIYEVTRVNDSMFSSAVYTIKNDSLWIGAWKTPKAFDTIATTDVVLKKGCEVLLKKIGANHYKGATKKNSCESTLRGASFAESKVEIKAASIESWDQGFDSEGNQVWGAEKGGYIFNKID